MMIRGTLTAIGALMLFTSETGLAGGIYSPNEGEGRYILTPPAQPAPEINGPNVFGVRPGSPFLFTIPASGKRPMEFSAADLPEGLSVDKISGVISGKIASTETKNYTVKLRAKNELGEAEKALSIIVGKEICLTPPLGWNSWNCWGNQVDQEKVLNSARAMKEKGLIDYGWVYINIDDAWQGKRGGEYNAIQGDPEKFPDIKNLCDEVHDLGLKIGIYSSPWITTYAGRIGGSSDNEDGEWDFKKNADGKSVKKDNQRIGKYRFDENDAKQWAEWGFDYLKYDWNPNDPESTKSMADALKKSGRDIVYSLSNTAPLEHAQLYAEIANCWRTAGDLKDRWDQDGAHLNIVEQWDLHRKWMEEGLRGGPGHFPDPDMLVVGDVVENNVGSEPRPSRLTPNEQYAHISLWTLWAAPMLIGCPIETMDDFTLNLLTNPDVLAIHQDAKAVPGHSIEAKDNYEIIVKDLADGSKAVGLFNKDTSRRTMNVDLKALGFKGTVQIRDLWRRENIGQYSGVFTAKVPPHGVILIRAGK